MKMKPWIVWISISRPEEIGSENKIIIDYFICSFIFCSVIRQIMFFDAKFDISDTKINIVYGFYFLQF